jgi:2-polyprenyl-3-methyl-5-hydroxy-6-metoxy-1,4-benzoquinol methylase
MTTEEYIKLQEKGSAWTEDYVTYQNLLSEAIYALAGTLGEDKHLSILDLGGGDGWGTNRIKELGFENVTCGDISEAKVKKARERGVNAEVMDMHDVKGKWDVIFCSHTLEHSLDIEKALNSMADALNDKGLLFLVVPIEAEDPKDVNPSHTQWVNDSSVIVDKLKTKLKPLAFFEKVRGGLEYLEYWGLWQK